MASNHKHSTDRVDGRAVATCTECDEYAVSLDYGKAEADNEILKQLEDFIGDTCPHCGGDVGFMQSEKPSEVLE